jgi:hypothetical protein
MRIPSPLAALLLVAAPAFSAWSPPADPDPQAILAEAHADRVQGRLDDALAKHVWLHTEGLRARPSFVGVRNTFALAEWNRLGYRHPPALEQLRAFRDTAEAQVRADRRRYDAFLDFAAINRTLDEETRTRDLFVWLDTHDAAMAERLHEVAQPALVESRDYALAAKYLRPSATLERLARGYQFMVGDTRADERMRTFSSAKFTNEAATVVALLAVNDRKREAELAAAAARQVLDTPAMKQALESALAGRMPEPFPTREARAALRASERQNP